MNQRAHNTPNIVLLRGAALWLLMALVLAWCMVGLNFDVHFLKRSFWKQTRLIQAHIDFLLMTALILGFTRHGFRSIGRFAGRWFLAPLEIPAYFCWSPFFPYWNLPAGGRLIPHDLPILCDGKRFNDDLWIWGGGNHRLVVVIPACTSADVLEK